MARKFQCKHPTCNKLLNRRGWCDKHYRPELAAERRAAERRAEHDSKRGSASARGYSSKWRRERLKWLDAHPLCVTCKSEGLIVAATIVDHIEPHRGDRKLFWRRSNWQSLCKTCHDQKTRNETKHKAHDTSEINLTPHTLSQ